MGHTPSDQPIDTADVVIVGCGPVGAMLANLLGLQGVRTLVLEREASIYALPRAVHFDDEIMRLLQTVGLADAMQPHVHVSPGMKFVDAAGKLLLDWSRPQEIGPQGWYASYRFHQPDLERIMRDGLKRWPMVSLMSRAEVYALHQDADGVSVNFEDLASGRLRTCRARYVVGCDGARSLVRRLIGAPMEDLGFHERWLVVDGLLKRPRPDLGDYSVQYCNKERPATYVRGVGNRRRWEITVLPHEDSSAVVAPANVYKLLETWVTPEDADLERAVIYTFHSAIAQQWRAGRLLIAGDSAHLTPPFLGQGMCAGMRDAANLAWKLARVLHGVNDDALLDTYQSERLPHVREYIELAVRLGGLINTKAMAAAVPDAARDGGEPARMNSIKPQLGPGVFAGNKGLSGRLAPQHRHSDGAFVDDRTGYEYAMMLRPDLAARLDESLNQKFASRRIVAIEAKTSEQLAWLASLDAQAVLLRPDRYILGAAQTPSELNALIAAA